MKDQRHPSFYAEDAFFYVKVYNELISKNMQQISVLKEEFEKKYWDGTSDDHFFYIKLRAFEHALQYKETGQQPTDMILIGDDTGQGDSEMVIREEKLLIETQKGELQEREENIDLLNGRIREDAEREQQLQSKLQSSEQRIQILQRKLRDTQGAYAIGSAAIITLGIIIMFVSLR